VHFSLSLSFSSSFIIAGGGGGKLSFFLQSISTDRPTFLLLLLHAGSSVAKATEPLEKCLVDKQTELDWSLSEDDDDVDATLR
jgi:hypothetical protein